MLAMHEDVDGSLYLIDTRRELAAAPRRAVLTGWKASVFLACDRASTMRHLLLLPVVVLDGVTEDELRGFLERCAGHSLMVRNDRTWLNVAVHVPARAPHGEALLEDERVASAALAG
jgi:hypothetical protein